jgi:hypothetical protein
MKAKCMQCGGSTKKMKTGGAKGKCPFGQCWDDINEVCKPCPSSTYGTLGAASGALAVGSKMIGSAIKKGQAKRQAKKEINKSVNNALNAAKKSSIMKTGGAVKKMAKGGQALNNAKGYAKPQTGGDNVKMGIYGIPNAGRTDSLGFKKGGAVKKYAKGGFPDLSKDGKITKKDILIGKGVIPKAKFGASVSVQHSPAPGRVRSSSGTGTVPVGMRKKKGGAVKK